MEAGTPKLENDVEKTQFQQELNRWFESRGIIADLRSHLRHLMILALQSTQMGLKPVDKSSPKAQAVNLIVAEYLYRHKCHYTLSVFTSEVPTLANFHPDFVFQGGKASHVNRKQSKEKCFQEEEVEEIFSALGMSSREEELALLKDRYLDKSNDSSLIELFFQSIVEMSKKLLIRQNLKSFSLEVKGERLLSKEWSSRIADILLNEKMTSPQIIALEEAIFRTTESEIRRIMEEERRLQMHSLSERERRIQEYLKKHEEEILLRLIEAEKDLAMQKDIIVEEMSDREKHLTKMVMEWRNKHEEIIKLSKIFHNIESENKDLQKKLKAFEEENTSLKAQGKAQSKTIDGLREEVNSLTNKLKEVADSNVSLTERIQTLIGWENKEVFVHQDDANQKTLRTRTEEIPLLWSKNINSNCDVNPVDHHNKNPESKPKSKKFTLKNPAVTHPHEWNLAEIGRNHSSSGDAETGKMAPKSNLSEEEEEEEDVSLSSSSEDIILSVRKRLQDLEEETNRINHNYLEYKSKCVWVESDSESPSIPSAKTPPIVNEPVIKESKFSQTNSDDIFTKIQKIKEFKERKLSLDDFGFSKKSEEVPPVKSAARPPTKRQLQHRDFFIKSRQLLQKFEKQDVENFGSTPSVIKSSGSSFNEELSENYKKFPDKSSPKLNSSSSASAHSSDASEPMKVQAESAKRVSECSNNVLKAELDCLALLEESRIKSPKIVEKRSLRQHILSPELEEELDKDDAIIENCFESTVILPSQTPN